MQKNTKELNCRECGTLVKNVGVEAVAVICIKCTSKNLKTFIENDEIETINKDKEELN